MKTQVLEIWVFIQKSRPYRAFSRFTEVGGNILSSGMSFQALFAVFAGMWVAFSVLASWLRKHDEIVEVLTEQINTFVPGLIEVDEVGAIPLQKLLNMSSFSLSGAIASVSLLWVAIAWFTGTRRAVRLIYGLDVKEYKNAVLLKVRDFISALIFFVAILLSAVLTVASSGIFSWLLENVGVSEDNWLVGTLGSIFRYGLLFAVDVMIVYAINRFLAEVKLPWRQILYGSLIGGAALLGLKVLGTALLGGATSNPLLATFAVVVGLLIWFNLICRVLLLTSSWIATGTDKTLGLPLALTTKLDA